MQCEFLSALFDSVGTLCEHPHVCLVSAHVFDFGQNAGALDLTDFCWISCLVRVLLYCMPWLVCVFRVCPAWFVCCGVDFSLTTHCAPPTHRTYRYTMGLNQFSHLTSEQFKAYMHRPLNRTLALAMRSRHAIVHRCRHRVSRVHQSSSHPTCHALALHV